MTRQVVSCIALAAAGVAVGAAVAVGARGAAASPEAKPKWLVIPGFWPQDSGPEVIGSASGRGWLGFAKGDGLSRSTILGSLRGGGGKLSFAKTVLTASQGPMMIVGSQLFYHLADVSGTPSELREVPLLSDGRIGTPRAVPDPDPEKMLPQKNDPVAVAALRVADRIVWVVVGSTTGTISPRIAFVHACCSSGGELGPDLKRFFDLSRPSYFYQLGFDSKGRLWLAWLESSRGALVGAVKLLELDPETLAPRTATAATPSGGRTATRFELSCAAFCRVVMSDSVSGDVFVSSPGRGSPARIASGTPNNPVSLLAASDRSGHLAVASAESVRLERPPWKAERISLARGDARGLQPRRVGGSVDLPTSLGHSFLFQFPVKATFVPGGLVYFAMYFATRSYTATRVLAGFLPLGR